MHHVRNEILDHCNVINGMSFYRDYLKNYCRTATFYSAPPEYQLNYSTLLLPTHCR